MIVKKNSIISNNKNYTAKKTELWVLKKKIILSLIRKDHILNKKFSFYKNSEISLIEEKTILWVIRKIL